MLGRAALMLFGFACAIFVGEIAFRLLRLIPDDQLMPFPYRHEMLARIAANETYIRFDAELGWTPRPGTTQSAAGVTYAANTAGIRADREIATQPPDGVRRFAAFGDSFTYCDEVDLADCWTTQLEAAVPGTEVLNFGAPGYGPDQAWLRYQREGSAYQPCVVFIGYMPENLNRTLTRFFPFYEPSTSLFLSKPRFQLNDDRLELLPNPVTDLEQLTDSRAVETLLGPGDDWYFPGVFAAGPFDGLMVTRLVRTTLYHRRAAGAEGADFEFLRAGAAGPAWAGAGDPEAFDRALAQRYAGRGDGLEITTRILTKFARSVERAGATPVIVIFPRRSDVVGYRATEPPVYAPLLERIAAAGVPVVDLLPPLAHEARFSRTRTLFAPHDHYSPRANRVVAERLAQELPLLTSTTSP